MTLDAIERAQQLNPVPSTPRRHRLEHIESISTADIGRFGSLGVIASMQPYHANPNSNIFSVWAANLGSERASRAWVWKSIQDAGGTIAFGSDWPVVGLDPRLGMHIALTRQTLQGRPEEGFLSSQRLPLASVIDAYTRGSAFAENAEGQKGTLKAGLLADVVVWDRDLNSLPVDQVHSAKVTTTILDGQVVFEQKEMVCWPTKSHEAVSSNQQISKCLPSGTIPRFRKANLLFNKSILEVSPHRRLKQRFVLPR